MSVAGLHLQMVQRTGTGCYALGALANGTALYYNQPGNASYMVLVFAGGEGGRSTQVTYHCDPTTAGGTNTFAYELEVPANNFVRMHRRALVGGLVRRLAQPRVCYRLFLL